MYAAVTFPSNDVTYDNTQSGLQSTTVKGASMNSTQSVQKNPQLEKLL